MGEPEKKDKDEPFRIMQRHIIGFEIIETTAANEAKPKVKKRREEEAKKWPQLKLYNEQLKNPPPHTRPKAIGPVHMTEDEEYLFHGNDTSTDPMEIESMDHL